MDMVKIEQVEQVIVGSETRSPPPVIKPEPVVAPVPAYHHESLQCFQCFITFCNAKAKDRHMRHHHQDLYKLQLQQTETLFTCYKCVKCFSSSEELSQHQATHNTEEKSFLCTHCHKVFSTYTEVNKHRRHECLERRYHCRDCGDLFPSPSLVRSHRIVAHPQKSSMIDDINTYRCYKCGGGFRTEEKLIEHQEKFASAINCDVNPQGKKRGHNPKDTPQEEMVESKKIKEEEEEEEIEGYGDSPKEGCSSTELKIPCPEADCDLTFPSVEALRAHKKESHGPASRKAHTCTQCDESYARPEQLKAHVARAHKSGYNCATCGKGFARESTLKAHQHTHTEGEEAAEQR